MLQRTSSPPPSFKGRIFAYTGLLLLVTTITSLILLATTPPTSRDALTHHLAIPKLYLQHGRIYEIPELIFSYYPMNLDLLYLIPLQLNSDILSKYIHLSFGLATAWLIFYYLEKKLSRNWGIIGALLFLSTPIIICLATSAYVDLGVCFFTTASLLLILQWSNSQKLSFLIVAGILTGLAIGTKYNGLITCFLLSCFIPFLTPNNNSTGGKILKVKPALLFFLFAMLICSPWFIRNYLWTENPIFPLFHSFFSQEQTPITRGMNPLLIRKLVYNEPLWQTLLIPIRIFFEGRDNNPQFFDGVLNPFFFLFPLTTFLPGFPDRLKTDKKLFFWFASLFFLFAFTQRVIRIRYIVPALPCIIILSTFGLYNLRHFLKTKRKKLFTAVLPVFLIVALFSNVIYLINYWQKISPLQYISGKIDRATYIKKYWPEYPLIDYVNNNLPQDVTVLAIFLGNRGYYFDRPVRFDLLSGKSLLCSEIQKQTTPKDVVTTLNAMGITHLFIRKDLFSHWVKQWLNKDEQDRLVRFFKYHTNQVTSVGNYMLLNISTH